MILVVTSGYKVSVGKVAHDCSEGVGLDLVSTLCTDPRDLSDWKLILIRQHVVLESPAVGSEKSTQGLSDLRAHADDGCLRVNQEKIGHLSELMNLQKENRLVIVMISSFISFY